ncbi:MAG: ribokinase, partial [Lachnospiraceae bacterium]|nr:ribokinase [Lachnospiraceae bacterium]
FGSLNLDYTYDVDHFVSPGETLSASAQALSPGGKGLNQSVALAKAGAEVYHAGCIGKGGEMLQKTLEQAGVNTDYLREVPELQGNAVIQVIPSGENCILLFGGSNRCITVKQIDETLRHFGKGDCLLLQNEVNVLPEIIDKAYEKGLNIFLNPSPCDEKIKKADLSKIRWLLVNEVEMKQLTGEENPEKAWEFLHRKYPALSLLVTLGSEGSAAFTEQKTVRQAAFPVTAVDTTGAGDTFTGYFITSLTEGLPLPQCLRRASMASAIAVTRAGAAASVPGKKEVLEALDKT